MRNRSIHILIALLICACALAVPAQTTTPASVQINAGGATSGSYLADTDFTGGSTFSATAAVDTSKETNPAPQAMYQTTRWGTFTYRVPNLTPTIFYEVKLHFAETTFDAVGEREFNVVSQGVPVLTNFDIFSAAGGKNIAVVESFLEVSASDGSISIQFTPGKADQPSVSGIEVIPILVSPIASIFTPGTVYPVALTALATLPGSLAEALLPRVPVNPTLIVAGVLSGFSFTLTVNGVTLNCLTAPASGTAVNLNCVAQSPPTSAPTTSP